MKHTKEAIRRQKANSLLILMLIIVWILTGGMERAEGYHRALEDVYHGRPEHQLQP